ncbi:MAG: hypothetical protein C4542_00465 [Dehalococcoidia bacterium]|nr:MAG: hypothetical protein C4542_00465 [Dehalococcoidia bacterium]
MLISDVINQTLSYAKSRGFAQETLKGYSTCLHLTLKYLTKRGIKEIEDVTYQILEDYINYLKERSRLDFKPGTVSISTINKHIKAIRGCFKYLHQTKRIKENPSENLTYFRRVQKVINSFSVEQLHVLLSVIPINTFIGQRERLLILTLVDCGLRISEALALQVNNIFFDQHVIKVYGKGSKERLVPFGRNAEKAMRQWIMAHSLTNEDRIFFSRRRKTITGSGVRMHLRRYGRKAGIKNVEVRPHIFRHTFAVMFLRSGGNLFILQRIMGHVSLDMTQRYCNLLIEDLQKEHRKHSPGDKLKW